MNLILKSDPVWLGSLPFTNASPTLLLLGGDGHPVPVSAPLLLAVSPLVRSILTDLLPPAYCPCILSLPAVTEEVLHVMLDILATGAAGDHMDKMQDVRQGFRMLGVEVSLVSCHLASIEALNKSSKVENYSEEPEEKNMELEITVQLENKNSADVEGKVVKSKRLRKNLYQKTAKSIKLINIQDKFTCNLCPQRFTKKADLVRHIKSGHDQNKIPCNICQQKFTRKDHLVRHIKAVHDQIKFPCNICPHKFTQKWDLVTHIKAVHDQIKIPCNICPKKFTQKANLVTHIKTVHDQIKIPCNQCSKKFAQKGALGKHIKSVHEKISL